MYVQLVQINRIVYIICILVCVRACDTVSPPTMLEWLFFMGYRRGIRCLCQESANSRVGMGLVPVPEVVS